MEIKAQIVEGIKYKPILKCNLTEISIENFNINSAKSACLVSSGQNRFAVSKWVSPKRTRSYPYERVYNTFLVSKRITIVPVVKDEGEHGDRDLLKWGQKWFKLIPYIRLLYGIVPYNTQFWVCYQESFRIIHEKRVLSRMVRDNQ
jgi:hypothetical protein